MTSQPQMAKQYFSSSMINNVFNLCRNRWAEKGRTSPPHAVALGGGGACRGRDEEDVLEAEC